MECAKYVSFYLIWIIMDLQILGVGDLLDERLIYQSFARYVNPSSERLKGIQNRLKYG